MKPSGWHHWLINDVKIIDLGPVSVILVSNNKNIINDIVIKFNDPSSITDRIDFLETIFGKCDGYVETEIGNSSLGKRYVWTVDTIVVSLGKKEKYSILKFNNMTQFFPQ